MRVRSRGWTLRLLGALFGLFALSGSVLAEDFLPPEQAFVLTTTPQPDQTVRVHWQVAPGYHLYRDRISFQGEGPATEWKAVALPKAKEVFDSNFNRSMAV